MHGFAQSSPQLFNQVVAERYAEQELQQIIDAYQLCMELFTGQFRGSGKTFIAHLVGTASVLVAERAPVDVVVAGLLHAAYSHGEFGDWCGGITGARREAVRRVVGTRVETLIAEYTRLPWSAEVFTASATRLDSLSDGERDVLRIRMANEVEEHLDLGILHCANAEARRERFAQHGPLFMRMSAELGCPKTAHALEGLMAEISRAHLPPLLRTAGTRSSLLLPRSCIRRRRPRLRHWLNRQRSRLAQMLIPSD